MAQWVRLCALLAVCVVSCVVVLCSWVRGFVPVLKGLGKIDLLFISLTPVQGPCTVVAGRRTKTQALLGAGPHLGIYPPIASESGSSSFVADLHLVDY